MSDIIFTAEDVRKMMSEQPIVVKKPKHSYIAINTDSGQELLAFTFSEYNLQVDKIKKETVKKFTEKCVEEMKKWYWNENLHSKTSDPLVIDDMTSNAIVTIRQIASEFNGE